MKETKVNEVMEQKSSSSTQTIFLTIRSSSPTRKSSSLLYCLRSHNRRLIPKVRSLCTSAKVLGHPTGNSGHGILVTADTYAISDISCPSRSYPLRCRQLYTSCSIIRAKLQQIRRLKPEFWLSDLLDFLA
jgi:hypothetical protein